MSPHQEKHIDCIIKKTKRHIKLLKQFNWTYLWEIKAMYVIIIFSFQYLIFSYCIFNYLKVWKQKFQIAHFIYMDRRWNSIKDMKYVQKKGKQNILLQGKERSTWKIYHLFLHCKTATFLWDSLFRILGSIGCISMIWINFLFLPKR